MTQTLQIVLLFTVDLFLLCNSENYSDFVNNLPLQNETSKRSYVKKWQVGRVSRRQYEIMNMFWRKTKVFEDVDVPHQSCNSEIYEKMKAIEPKKNLKKLKSQQGSENKYYMYHPTESIFEFYYMDETENSTKNASSQRMQPSPDLTIDAKEKEKVFEVHQYNHTDTVQYSNNQTKNITDISSSPSSSSQSLPSSSQSPPSSPSLPSSSQSLLSSSQLLPLFLQSLQSSSQSLPSSSPSLPPPPSSSYHASNVSTESTNHTVEDVPTKMSDKISFFEIFDVDTPDPLDFYNDADNSNHKNRSNKKKYPKIIQEKKQIDNESKREENHVAKHVKKSVRMYNNRTNEHNVKKVKIKKHIEQRHNYSSSYNFERPASVLVNNVSQSASWADYPFIAVYVNDRYKVICEAASLSPHWLLASASCLSRHEDDHSAELQSAYVAYCGPDWEHPERIAYVKSTIIHPMFNPKNNMKKYNYNVGVIQVANSMSSSCTGWSRTLLMSYHFLSSQEGSNTLAVGWGIDRLGVVNKRSFSKYKGYIYSDYCPGNVYISREKRLRSSLVENLYCLALPSYTGEKRDPVHGTFLIVDGKIIALYLQEDRRPWGEQSAIYTGVWKLIPWLNEVVKEPVDNEFITFDL